MPLWQAAKLQGVRGVFQAGARRQRKVQCGFPLYVPCKRHEMEFVCPLVAGEVNYQVPPAEKKPRSRPQTKESQN